MNKAKLIEKYNQLLFQMGESEVKIFEEKSKKEVLVLELRKTVETIKEILKEEKEEKEAEQKRQDKKPKEKKVPIFINSEDEKKDEDDKKDNVISMDKSEIPEPPKETL